MDLEGKRIVVVGGSRGLGRGLAEAFAVRAAEVTVVARNAAAVQGPGEQPAVTARLMQPMSTRHGGSWSRRDPISSS
ncbi:NAD(P)-dependent dehydrogenase (short-subunit alcohol dehydrogenase family) [Rhizobium leguminosarum]